jgi:hypothetical protein
MNAFMSVADQHSVLARSLATSLTQDNAEVINAFLFGPSKDLLKDVVTLDWLRGHIQNQNRLSQRGPLFSLLYKAQETFGTKGLATIIHDSLGQGSANVIGLLKEEKHLWSSFPNAERDRVLVAVATALDEDKAIMILDTESLKKLSPEAMKTMIQRIMDKKGDDSIILARLRDQVLPKSPSGKPV